MNRVVIFYGSQAGFEKIAPATDVRNLTSMVMEIDTDSRSFIIELPDKPIKEKAKPIVKNFIVESNEYAGVREHVILNFANFLAKMDVENLYLQNPPLSISHQIEKLFPQTEIIKQTYKSLTKDALVRLHNSYEESIKGQNEVLTKLLQALYPLTMHNRTKPAVILFYGDTGLGKTETAQLISGVLGENLFRKQFSMFQNNQFATYLFGGAHYERSFAKELLDRESNVILLDEFDKANSTFHSAFYQLFDEGIYEDQNYHIELLRSIIICTSNYKSEDDIKNQLGKAIFSRFDAVIKFNDLSISAKNEIASIQFDEKFEKYSEDEQVIIANENIREQLIAFSSSCSNAREISHLVEDTFSLVLLRNLFNE
ncbi:AAA family ATPase [Eisenbergiella tayi]|uniref:AAA family ATPase n=1 Tax=Eisenbergiella tayi TaxID=1432052 RepID=UPI000848CBBB|nr:AAA family ATPase [Eisenbergiella tayi]ODR33136.1 AAA family ATPase [Eisenbergiella tayi]